jgi:hypothetical protein
VVLTSVDMDITDVGPEALTAAKVDNIVSGYRPCQLVNSYRHFRDHVCVHHEGYFFCFDAM